MAHYAEIVNGVVANVAVCDDPAFATAQGWHDIDTLDPQPGVGWAYDGTTWTPPTPPTTYCTTDGPHTSTATSRHYSHRDIERSSGCHDYRRYGRRSSTDFGADSCAHSSR